MTFRPRISKIDHSIRSTATIDLSVGMRTLCPDPLETLPFTRIDTRFYKTQRIETPPPRCGIRGGCEDNQHTSDSPFRGEINHQLTLTVRQPGGVTDIIENRVEHLLELIRSTNAVSRQKTCRASLGHATRRAATVGPSQLETVMK